MSTRSHYLLNVVLLTMLHAMTALSQYIAPNLTATSFCANPLTLYFPSPYPYAPFPPVTLSSTPPHNTSYTDSLKIEPSDGSMYVEISTGEASSPSVDRLEVEYRIAWGSFSYNIKVFGNGFQDGKVWLGASDPSCPSVLVDELGQKTWNGSGGNSGAWCSTRPINLLVNVCV